MILKKLISCTNLSFLIYINMQYNILSKDKFVVFYSIIWSVAWFKKNIYLLKVYNSYN